VGAVALGHDLGLLVGYGVALAAWLGLARLLPRLWPVQEAPRFERPWVELWWVLGAIPVTLLLAWLHARGLMLIAPGLMGAVAGAVEQVIVFAPVLAVPRLRGQGGATAWLPGQRILLRIAIGVLLSELALLGHRAPHGIDAWLETSRAVYDPENLPYLAQSLCQDLAFAILFVRLRAVMGRGWTVALMAAGFALAQLPGPALDAEGIIGLVIDGSLGALVILAFERSSDVWWFCWVHFAMDMVR